jgi:hypothetical protein
MTPTLDSTKLVETAEKVRARVAERFPDAGLAKVAADVVAAARDASGRAAAIARPDYWLWAGQVLLAVVALAAVAAYFAAGTGGQPF